MLRVFATVIAVILLCGVDEAAGRKCVCTSKACRESGAKTCRTRFSCYTELIVNGETAGVRTTRGCTEGATPLLCETKSWRTSNDPDDRSNNSLDSLLKLSRSAAWPRLTCCDTHDYCNAADEDFESSSTNRPLGDEMRSEKSNLENNAADELKQEEEDYRNRVYIGRPSRTPIPGGAQGSDGVQSLHVAALVLAIAALISVFAACYVVTSKILLIYYGLWPYQSRLTKRFNYSIYSISSVSLIIPMIQGLSDDTSTDTVIFYETMVTALMVFGGFAQCAVLYARENSLRNMCDQIDANWQKLTDVKERVIFHSFARRGRALMSSFIAITINFYFVFMILTNIPSMLGNVATKDASKTFPYYSKRWIINERLRNLQVFVHTLIVTFYSGVAYIVAITPYIYGIKHFCGIYAIAAYRLKNLTSTRRVMYSNLPSKYTIVPELQEIVIKHKEAIKGIRMIGQIYCRTYFIVEICFLGAFAMILFDIRSNLFNPRLLIRICSVAVIFFLHTFYINYGGEMVIQFSDNIRLATYCMQWYSISYKARKVLLMIIRRCQKPDTLNYINMTYSNANVVKILRSAWSLAAVLIAIHGVK